MAAVILVAGFATGAKKPAEKPGEKPITDPLFLKVTGNPATYRNLVDNIDLNAGTILDGGESLNSVGRRIFDSVVEVASGRLTKAEVLGFHEFIVFRTDRAAETLLGHC